MRILSITFLWFFITYSTVIYSNFLLVKQGFKKFFDLHLRSYVVEFGCHLSGRFIPMVLTFLGKKANIAENTYVAPSADIIGEVSLGKDSSVWFHATLRGDVAPIFIGEGTNIQDNAVVHVSQGIPTLIGKNVTIGHGAIIHSCTIGEGCLIGMGSIILDGVVLNEDTLVGAGTLIPPGKTFPPKTLLIGNPAKAVRNLTDQEIVDMHENTRHYQKMAQALLQDC
jgi:carbonic anhydrase/acetyltransferase-like protein (isoleucine patch superfamily)